MSARRLISGTGSKGLTGARGVEKLANRLERIRWRQFVLARVNRTPRKSVRARHRKYIFAMRRNKRATHEIYIFLKAGEAKQGRYTCNLISPSVSHEVKQTRYT